MKRYRSLKPEIHGGYGKKAVIARETFPPTVHKLHYVFDGWLGDDLVTSFPIFMVTERLKDSIVSHKLTGVEFDFVLVTKSELFFDVHGDLELPKFWWMKVLGVEDIDDFLLTRNADILVSEEVYDVLREFSLNDCTISEYP